MMPLQRKKSQFGSNVQSSPKQALSDGGVHPLKMSKGETVTCPDPRSRNTKNDHLKHVTEQISAQTFQQRNTVCPCSKLGLCGNIYLGIVKSLTV